MTLKSKLFLIVQISICYFLFGCNLNPGVNKKIDIVEETKYPLSPDDPRAMVPDYVLNAEPNNINVPDELLTNMIKNDEESEEDEIVYEHNILTKTEKIAELNDQSSYNKDEAVSEPFYGKYALFNNQNVDRTIFGEDGRIKASSLSYPQTCICHITAEFPNTGDRKFQTTGFLIGNRTIVTAGHAVHNKDRGGWATQVSVTPALDKEYQPFGQSWARKLYTSKEWKDDKNLSYDWGVIVVNSDFGTNTGWLGIGHYSKGKLKKKYLYNAGYPGDKPSGTMWKTDPNKGEKLSKISGKILQFKHDISAGQSGSPLYASDHIAVGIVTLENSDYNKGMRINKSRYKSIKKIKDENDN